jgi:HAMP domain-containing protein
MKLSLRARLIWSFLVIIVATAGLVAFSASRITLDRFTYMVSHAGQMKAERLAPLFADYYVQTPGWQGVHELVETLAGVTWGPGHGRWQQEGRMMGMMGMMGMMSASAITGDERLLLADADGAVIADSAGAPDGARLPADSLAKGAPITVNGQQIGTLIVASSLGSFTPDQSAFLKQVNTLMLAAAVGAGLAVLAVGSLQARRIVAPVQALSEAARRIAGGDFSQRVPITTQDELAEMAGAFNTMAAELEHQHTLRRRAMADIAHELRTPLSVLQIELESIEDGLTAAGPEVIGGLREEVALLNRLVEDLRTCLFIHISEPTRPY